MRADTIAVEPLPPLEGSAIRVALVDDQVLVRAGIRMMLDARTDITVEWEANDGFEAMEMLAQTPVDVMLMDIRMPGIDGVETTKRIMAAGYNVRIIILTTFDVDDYVYEALRSGARGFLLKDARATELVDAIYAVRRGDAIMAPSVTKRLLTNLVPRPDTARRDPRLDALTDREIEVLTMIAQGANNTELSENLHMAEGTVKTHISRLLSKLQARDRVGLVLLAQDMGLADK